MLPPRCVLCDGPGQQARELWGIDLCPWCEAACLKPQPTDLAFDPRLDALHALYLYEDPADRLITGLKFHGNLACARVLGTLLSHRIIAADIRLPQVLVPLPLHAARRRERGFNQAAAIAAHLGARIRVPIDNWLLQRVRATVPQTTLSAAERRQNCIGAFAVQPGRHPPARVALIDDVMTTGSTAGAAAEALRAAGARHIELWACAVAPHQG